MPTKHICRWFLPDGRCKQCFEFPPTPSEAKAIARKEGYTAGLLAGLEWAYSQDTLCCHVYGTPTDAVSKAIAHVKATGALPGEAGT